MKVQTATIACANMMVSIHGKAGDMNKIKQYMKVNPWGKYVDGPAFDTAAQGRNANRLTKVLCESAKVFHHVVTAQQFIKQYGVK